MQDVRPNLLQAVNVAVAEKKCPNREFEIFTKAEMDREWKNPRIEGPANWGTCLYSYVI